MRIVLYDDETFEPLTVLNIPHWRQLRLQEGEPIVVPVPSFLMPVPLEPDHISDGPERFPTVQIRFELLMRRGEHHWLAVTHDAQSALRLRAVFLPGQNGEVKEREAAAFVKGFGEAVLGACR